MGFGAKVVTPSDIETEVKMVAWQGLNLRPAKELAAACRREIIGLEPAFAGDNGIEADRADIGDEVRPMPGDLRIVG